MLRNWLENLSMLRNTEYRGRGFVLSLLAAVFVLVTFATIVAWQVHVQTFNIWFGLSRFIAVCSLIALGPNREFSQGVSWRGRVGASVLFATALFCLVVALQHSKVI